MRESLLLMLQRGVTFMTPQDYENPDDADKNGSYLVQVTASDGKASVTQAITVSLTNDTTENALPIILPGNNAATHTQNYGEK